MGQTIIGCVLLAFFAAGCSGKSSSNGDDSTGGGTSGTSGTGGTGTGGTGTGGSGGSARPPKVGLYVMIRNPDASVPEVAGRSCPASTGVEWDLGQPIETNGQVIDVDSPTPTDFGSTLEDGEHGATVACTVLQDGTFSVDGGGVDPQITPPNGLINFHMTGVASDSGTPSTNSATGWFYTPVTLNMAANLGFPACAIAAVHEQAPGALWADFDCPALTRVGSPNLACRASGTLVIEYCETGE
jgi:hypothetical protein